VFNYYNTRKKTAFNIKWIVYNNIKLFTITINCLQLIVYNNIKLNNIKWIDYNTLTHDRIYRPTVDRHVCIQVGHGHMTKTCVGA